MRREEGPELFGAFFFGWVHLLRRMSSAFIAPHMAEMPQQPAATGDAPASSGMSAPQAPEGEFASAKLDAFNAMKLLDRAIAKVGAKSEEGRAMLKARATLTERFGEHEEESAQFSRAELQRMLMTLAGPGEPPQPKQPSQAAPQPMAA